MKVFNPTGWKIEAKSAGRPYTVEPFSELEIYDIYDVQHICQSFGYLGLVDLEYGPMAQEVYSNFDEYKKAQELKGLNEILKFKEQNLRDEKQAARDIKEKRGGENMKEALNIERFEKEIVLIKKWIMEAGGKIEKKEDRYAVVAERPEWKPKAKVETVAGQKAKDEQRGNAGKGSVSDRRAD